MVVAEAYLTPSGEVIARPDVPYVSLPPKTFGGPGYVYPPPSPQEIGPLPLEEHYHPEFDHEHFHPLGVYRPEERIHEVDYIRDYPYESGREVPFPYYGDKHYPLGHLDHIHYGDDLKKE